MKKKELIFLVSFSALDAYLNFQKNFINLACQNFKEIYFMNSDHLKILPEKFSVKKKISKKVYSGFPKKIKFFNPKTFKELDSFLKNKNPLVINNVGRTFETYGILFYFKKYNVSQILLGHIGNLQATIYEWHKYNLNIIKYFFTKLVSRWLTRFLIFFGIFKQIDIRFISNSKIYKGFNKQKESILFKIFPPYYKELILVKSKIFDEFKKERKNLKEKYIVLLDQDPEYREIRVVRDLDKELIKQHYLKLNVLLNQLKKIFNKKVIVSIHPLYNQKKTEKRFKNFEVIKFRTNQLLQDSFLVLSYDSSAILQAIKLKKKIITIQSKLFYGGKRYNSDLYADRVGLKRINIFKNYNLNKKKLSLELTKNLKNYDKYLNKYSSGNLEELGSNKIIRVIKERYF